MVPYISNIQIDNETSCFTANVTHKTKCHQRCPFQDPPHWSHFVTHAMRKTSKHFIQLWFSTWYHQNGETKQNKENSFPYQNKKKSKCLGGIIEFSLLLELALYISRVTYGFWGYRSDRIINTWINDYSSLHIILKSPFFVIFKGSTCTVHWHIHELQAHPSALHHEEGRCWLVSSQSVPAEC